MVTWYVHDPRFINTVHAFVNYFSQLVYGCSGGLQIEMDRLREIHPEDRGTGFGITRTDYRPEPSLTDMHLAMCANIERVKSRVGLHRWAIIYSLCHPESPYFTKLRPGCFTPPEGQTDVFHPSYDKYDKGQGWPRGWAERLFTSGIYSAASILFPQKKNPTP